MDGLWVCYKQLGVWCGVIFISHVWILCLIPLLSGRLGNCFKFCQTISRCPHSPTCRNQTAQRMKTGIYSFENAIITYILEKNSQFLYLFQRKHGELVQKFHLRVLLALLSFTRWCRYQADSVLLWRVTE